jgi:hypothetical protein
MTKKILSLTLFIKVTVLVLIFLAFNLLPFNSSAHSLNFLYPKDEKVSLASAYKTWDAQHYLFLSQKGYKVGSESDRFFPVLPFSIDVVNKLINNPLVAGLVVSNIFSFLGILYFFLFCRLLLKDEKQAFKSVLLLVVFPTAFFTSLIYSESVLVFLTSAFFYYLYSKKYFWAAIFVFFIPLARPVGVLIIFPYLVFWLNFKYKEIGRNYLNLIKAIFLDKKSYYLLSPALGVCLYFLIMQLQTGNYWEGMFYLQNSVIGGWKLSNSLDPIYFLVNLFSPGSFAIHGMTNSIIDRVFFVLYCISLVIIYKRLDKTMFVYALMVGMVPLFGNFMSYTRYMLMVLPMFIVLGKIFAEKKYDLFFYPTLFFMLMLQTLFIIMHALNYWVA